MNKQLLSLMNVKGVREIKNTLVNKFKDEGCCFNYNDVTVVDKDDMYFITIKEYEHMTFEIVFSFDDYFGYEVFCNAVYTDYPDESYNITYETSKQHYDVRHALIMLGYHIANTF